MVTIITNAAYDPYARLGLDQGVSNAKLPVMLLKKYFFFFTMIDC